MSADSPFVLVTSSFPVVGDGSEAAGSFVADLAQELAKHTDVRVVAPGAKSLREAWSDRIQVLRYASPPVPLSTLKPWRPDHLAWIARVLRGGLAATREAAVDSSHILALWGLPCGEWARRSARGSDVGYSVWMLGSDVWSLGRIPVVRGWLARVMRDAACAYADGYQLAQDARDIGGVPIQFLPSTRAIGLIDPPPPRARPPYRLLFLGRWHPNKGIDLLLDALHLLDDVDWSRIDSVSIQGGGPLEKLVHEQAAALRSRGRPVQVGHYLGKDEAEAAMANADWVLIPSRIESIPVVFSDAMKLGRPVVATPVGDLPRLLDSHRCGICASSIQPAAIADAIRTALAASPADYSGDVRLVAEEFSLPVIAQRLLQPCAQKGSR
jgi:glycosyltransferase involved in cell wall biosynthesis